MKQVEANDSEISLSGGRFLCFSLLNEKFAIPLLQVKEVIANTETTNVPQAPSYFKGIMNLRGQVISVIDLRAKLKLGKAEATQETTIIILDVNSLSIGVIVDSVDSVVAYDRGVISPPPEHESSVKTDYIIGVARDKDHLTLILDLRKALNVDDMKAVTAQNKKSA